MEGCPWGTKAETECFVWPCLHKRTQTSSCAVLSGIHTFTIFKSNTKQRISKDVLQNTTSGAYKEGLRKQKGAPWSNKGSETRYYMKLRKIHYLKTS